jgi:hypothetical protein
MDTTAALQEIESRVTARAFAAVMDQGPGGTGGAGAPGRGARRDQ